MQLDFREYWSVLVDAVGRTLEELSEETASGLGAVGILLAPPTLNPFWLLAWGEQEGWRPETAKWGSSVLEMSIGDGIDIGDPVGIGQLPLGTSSVLVTRLDGSRRRVHDPINTDELEGLLHDLVVAVVVAACKGRSDGGPKFVVVEVSDSLFETVLEQTDGGDYVAYVGSSPSL